MVFDKSNMLVYIIKSATDICGNTITNSGVGSANDEAGFSNGALDFDNKADYLELSSALGNAIATAMNDECTILWNVNYDVAMATEKSTTIISQAKVGAGDRAFLIGTGNYAVDDGFWLWKTIDGSTIAAYNSGANAFADSVWALNVFTFNSGSFQMSVNGSDVWDTTITSIYTASTQKLRFGAWNGYTGVGNPNAFKGKINNIQIHKKVLSKAHQHFATKWQNKKRIA